MKVLRKSVFPPQKRSRRWKAKLEHEARERQAVLEQWRERDSRKQLAKDRQARRLAREAEANRSAAEAMARVRADASQDQGFDPKQVRHERCAISPATEAPAPVVYDLTKDIKASDLPRPKHLWCDTVHASDKDVMKGARASRR